MKFSYLCIVNESRRNCSQGSQKMFSGLTNFTACPERKNGSLSATREQNPILTKKLYNYGTESKSSREEDQV